MRQRRLKLGSLAIAGGALQFLIHPDAALWWLAPVALIPLVMLARELGTNWRARFFYGWLAGFIHWFGLCYWIQGTLERHGGMNFAGSAAVFLLFCLAKGLHTAVFVTAAGWLAGSRFGVLLIAALWVGIERLHAPFGFTWLLLGNAGLEWPMLARIAPWTGVYGISLLLAITAASLARRDWKWLAIWIVPVLLPSPPASRATQAAIAVQPDFHEESPELEPERKLIELSKRPQARPVAVILWPEMPAGLYYDLNPRLREQVAELTRSSGSPLLFGSVARANTRAPLNSALLVDAEGGARIRYDKVNLVPFGEFVPWPFDQIVEKVTDQAGEFAPGAGPVVFPLNSGHRAGAFICYESAFPHYVREFAANGAEVFINLTNDGYFARSAARRQHLELARMRAIENRRWLLRPTNDGFTVAIDPAGGLHDAMPPYTASAGVLRFGWESAATPYTRYGDWLAWACLIAAASYGGLQARRRP